MPIDTPYKRLLTHFDDLKYASKKVSDLEKEIKEQEWRNHHLIRHSTHSILMIVLICLFLCYVLYKVVHCIRQRRSNLPCFRRRSNSRGGSPALMAPNGQGQTVNIHIQSSNESLTSLPDNQVQEDNPSLPTDTPRRVLRPRVAKTYF
jgi:hypothetical protein